MFPLELALALDSDSDDSCTGTTTEAVGDSEVGIVCWDKLVILGDDMWFIWTFRWSALEEGASVMTCVCGDVFPDSSITSLLVCGVVEAVSALLILFLLMMLLSKLLDFPLLS